MPNIANARRCAFLVAGSSAIAVAAVGVAGCERNNQESEVTANEDLMREHGVIRRSLLVYSETARRARSNPSSIPLADLLGTAKLFRVFAEDYHERGLEEAHIFPVVRRLSSPASRLPDILLAQHQRGREITDYIQAVSAHSSIAPSEAERFAATLDAFVAMYEPHTAWEDTVVFPAWKKALGEKNYEAKGDEFEELKHKMFGRDGFEDALSKIAKIEAAFGLNNIATVTASAPPPAA
jgi:hemerythrin-like domain-containing protein